jgi:predicted nucleic-acid-binding protein
MYAVVDFDRQQTFFFNSYQEASDFIAQYPVIETVVVVDASDEGAMCEML